MSTTVQPYNKIHPHKFNLWVAIGSIIMMFAGFTSAYVVKRQQEGWESYTIPMLFWVSTALILLSSLTIKVAKKQFKNRNIQAYRFWLLATLVLGIGFMVTQTIAFSKMWNHGITLKSNVAASFLYVIVGIHALHLLGGVVALIIFYIKSFSKKIKIYTMVPLDVLSTYWHFIGILWIYLLVFLLIVK